MTNSRLAKGEARTMVLLVLSVAGAMAAGSDGIIAAELSARGLPGGDEREIVVHDHSDEQAIEGTQNALGAARDPGALTIDDCFSAAWKANERIGRAREDLVRAELLRRTARAAVLPQLSAEGTYYRQNQVDLGASVASSTGGVAFTDRRREELLSLTQPIFHGLRDVNFFAAAKSGIEAARHGIDDASRLLYGDVAAAFYAVLEAEAQVRTFEETVKVEQERFREVGARRDVGLARKTEVLIIQSQLEQDKSRLTAAVSGRDLARERLAFLVGQPVESPLQDSPEVPSAPAADGEPSPEPDFEALAAVAAVNRSDLLASESRVEAAGRQVKVARGEYYPAVDFDANWILDRRGFSNFSEKTDWTAEIKVKLPIFDGGRIATNVASAESSLRLALLSRDELSRSVRLQVRSALLALHSDRAQMGSIETLVASAQESYRLVQEEYRSGLATNLEVITAQNQLLSGHLDLDRQRYQVKLDGIVLKIAQGLLPAGGASGSIADAAVVPGGTEAGQ
jgi:outer membrane protein